MIQASKVRIHRNVCLFQGRPEQTHASISPLVEEDTRRRICWIVDAKIARVSCRVKEAIALAKPQSSTVERLGYIKAADDEAIEYNSKESVSCDVSARRAQ
jgi:hypothetical protein